MRWLIECSASIMGEILLVQSLFDDDSLLAHLKSRYKLIVIIVPILQCVVKPDAL
jgi:hypothetical protein